MKKMIYSTRHVIYALSAVLLTICMLPSRAPGVTLKVNAKCAVIVDASNGSILFEKNADKKYPPASTAKVMTAIVAIEKAPLDSRIIPSASALAVEPTIAPLKRGVEYTLSDLVSAIMIRSANDAAVVIAEGIAGSEKKFAKLMNEKAAKIGMKNTNFELASGLPTGKKDRQYTTAKDLVIMMRYALRHKVILEKMSRKEETIYGSNGKKIYLKTHNKLLFRKKKIEAPWGKTGYTIEAKRTFVGVDPSYRPRVIFALLQSNDLWTDIMTLKDKGLELYARKHRRFRHDIVDWVRSERAKGRETVRQITGRE